MSEQKALESLVAELDAAITASLEPLTEDDRAYMAMIEERERGVSLVQQAYKAAWTKMICELAMMEYVRSYAIPPGDPDVRLRIDRCKQMMSEAGFVADSPIIVSR